MARIRRGRPLTATTTSPESVLRVDVARAAGRHDDVARVGPRVDVARVARHDVDVARVRVRAHEPLAAEQLEPHVARVALQPRLANVDPARLDVARVGVDPDRGAARDAHPQVAHARDEPSPRSGPRASGRRPRRRARASAPRAGSAASRAPRRTGRARGRARTSPLAGAHDDLVDRAGERVRLDGRVLEDDVGEHERGGHEDDEQRDEEEGLLHGPHYVAASAVARHAARPRPAVAACPIGDRGRALADGFASLPRRGRRRSSTPTSSRRRGVVRRAMATASAVRPLALGDVRARGARLHDARRRLARGQRGRRRSPGRRRRAPRLARSRHRRAPRRDPARHARASWRRSPAIFGAMGMYPVGFYDLRDAAPSPVPVVSTAFRPVDARRARAQPVPGLHLAARAAPTAGSSALTCSAACADVPRRPRAVPGRAARARRPRRARDDGLPADEAETLHRARRRGRSSSRPSRSTEDWYRALERRSRPSPPTSAASTSHAHQPPHPARPRHRRALRAHAGARHRDDRRHPGPAAVGRARRAAAPDVVPGARRAARVPARRRRRQHRSSLRVRFGEVEARGIALTAAGPRALRRAERHGRRAQAAQPAADRPRSPASVERALPRTERELALADLAYFTYQLAADRPPRRHDARRPIVAGLLDGGWVTAAPDRLRGLPAPRRRRASSSRTSARPASTTSPQQGAALDAGWLAGVLGRDAARPDLALRRRSASVRCTPSAARSTPGAHLSRS